MMGHAQDMMNRNRQTTGTFKDDMVNRNRQMRGVFKIHDKPESPIGVGGVFKDI